MRYTNPAIASDSYPRFAPMLKDTILESGYPHMGPWAGPALTKCGVRLSGFPPDQYGTVYFFSPGTEQRRQFHVFIDLDTKEEMQRKAEMFMDLINVLRVAE